VISHVLLDWNQRFWLIDWLRTESVHLSVVRPILLNQTIHIEKYYTCIFSLESRLTGCYSKKRWGTFFAVAGQRRNPTRKSNFVWRITSAHAGSDEVIPMKYTYWDEHTHQPDYHGNNESCMALCSGQSYSWNDYNCEIATCSVCEVDMWFHKEHAWHSAHFCENPEETQTLLWSTV